MSIRDDCNDSAIDNFSLGTWASFFLTPFFFFQMNQYILRVNYIQIKVKKQQHFCEVN